MLYTNFTVDDDSHYFATSIKHNNSSTVPRAQVALVHDTLKYQQNPTTNMKHQKLPLSGK